MFDDFFSSSRGPGVIGTLLAFVVLAGFSALALTSMDSRFNGQDATDLRKFVTHQQQRIEQMKALEIALNEAAIRAQTRREEKMLLDERLEELAAVKDEAAAATALRDSARAAWDDVCDRFVERIEGYRAAERERAVGEILPLVRTTDGRTYENATIKNVSAIGILIAHAHGSRRIAFEEFSPEIQDRFLFDAAERDQAMARQTRVERSYRNAMNASSPRPTPATERPPPDTREKRGRDLPPRNAYSQSSSGNCRVRHASEPGVGRIPLRPLTREHRDRPIRRNSPQSGSAPTDTQRGGAPSFATTEPSLKR